MAPQHTRRGSSYVVVEHGFNLLSLSSVDRIYIKPPSQRRKYRNIDETSQHCRLHGSFVLSLKPVYVRSVEDPRALCCQYHIFYSVADSTEVQLHAILGICAKLRSKLCTTKSTDGANPYFAPNTSNCLGSVSPFGDDYLDPRGPYHQVMTWYTAISLT